MWNSIDDPNKLRTILGLFPEYKAVDKLICEELLAERKQVDKDWDIAMEGGAFSSCFNLESSESRPEHTRFDLCRESC